MSVDVGMRLWYDLVYFIVIPVIWLNITFGIVIDTFSALRSAKNERAYQTTEFCFICGIDKQRFDRESDEAGEGFNIHIRDDHNMWSYLNFIFFIWEQDKDDDDGLEYYVRDEMRQGKITWFPLNKAMKLENAESEHELLAKKLHDSVEDTQAKLGTRLDDMRNDVGAMLDGLAEALKEVHVAKEDGYAAGGDEDGDVEWYPALGYNIYMSVKEINGLEVGGSGDVAEAEALLKQISVRIIADSGMYSLESTGADPTRKASLFAGDEFLVAENAQPNDKSSTVSIQILQGSSAGASKFVGVVEIPISEPLTMDSGAVVDKPFTRMGQLEACTLRIEYVYEQSRKFSRGAYDDDGSSV